MGCLKSKSPIMLRGYWQRDFMVFGGDFLMAQDAANLRGFFDSFFRLPLEYWSVSVPNWYFQSSRSHELVNQRL